MKRAFIGAALLIGGVIQTVGTLICGATLKQLNIEYQQVVISQIITGMGHGSLGLGVFFFFGIILVIIGLIILAFEFIHDKDK